MVWGMVLLVSRRKIRARAALWVAVLSAKKRWIDNLSNAGDHRRRPIL